MKPVVVSEYARLTTEPGHETLQEHSISPSAFEHVCKLAAGFKRGGVAQLLTLDGHRAVRLDQYVGVIETPCGTTIEILPKSASVADDVRESRRLLRKMLLVARGAKSRNVGLASIESLQDPLTEWVMAQFVRELRTLVRRGIRSEYREVETRERFVRGRLRVAAQLRESPARQHLVHIAYDELSSDRAENRLLRAALDSTLSSTRSTETWRVARELAVTMQSISASRDHSADFARWSQGRLMSHYTAVRPWCELVLGVEMPLAVHGRTRGNSLLFPMDKLFERYLEIVLGQQIVAPYILKAQSAQYSLVAHRPIGATQPSDYFALKPDLVVHNPGAALVACVIDAKWKRVNGARTTSGQYESLYDLEQSDLYQLHAYGHTYLAGRGDLLLVSPMWEGHKGPLPPFHFTPDLRLWVVPFDLNLDRLLLPEQLRGLPWLHSSVSSAISSGG